MDFEPCFKVYNLISVHPKSIKLGQMITLNLIFFVVVSVYRWDLKLTPVPCLISEWPHISAYQCSKLSWSFFIFSWLNMPSCSARDCKNRPEKDRERWVTFHNLPAKHIKFAKKWLEQLRRDERHMPKKIENLYICNEHFTGDCFKTEYRFELLGGNTRRRSLKKDASPTIFQWKTRIASERRIATKERKEVSYIKLFSF